MVIISNIKYKEQVLAMVEDLILPNVSQYHPPPTNINLSLNSSRISKEEEEVQSDSVDKLPSTLFRKSHLISISIKNNSRFQDQPNMNLKKKLKLEDHPSP